MHTRNTHTHTHTHTRVHLRRDATRLVLLLLRRFGLDRRRWQSTLALRLHALVLGRVAGWRVLLPLLLVLLAFVDLDQLPVYTCICLYIVSIYHISMYVYMDIYIHTYIYAQTHMYI